jgi:uncharacterized membrane protein
VKAIPSSALPELGRSARWTLVARIVLAAGLLAALAGAFLASRHDRSTSALLHDGRSPIVALDLSWSVASQRFELVQKTVRELASPGQRLGLILFSDTAYEALPPGTRSTTLRPFLRFFQGDGAASPWTANFSSGTRISAPLDLAREVFQRDHITNGSFVLVSDLADAANDETDLARALVAYERDRIPIKMVAINPSPEDERFFRSALEPVGGSVTTVRSGVTQRAAGGGGNAFPILLVVVAAMIALLLALNEQILGTLDWGRRDTA